MAKSAKNSVYNSQSVANKKSASRTRKPKQIIQVQEEVSTTPTVTPKLIIAHPKYTYGENGNVGCGCKTAKSAIRYMQLLKHRYGAMRLALFYCWRDDEKFHHIIREDSFAKYELRIAIV